MVRTRADIPLPLSAFVAVCRRVLFCGCPAGVHDRGCGMSKLRWPRTLHGWKFLFWISFYRCPIHHARLSQDWALYDDGKSLWCLACGGARLPRGAINALKENAKAVARRAALSQSSDDGGTK